MIISGTSAVFNNTQGVDDIEMPTCGHAWWGKVNVNQGSVVNININVGSGRLDLEAALWWPEAQTDQHDDVDLHIIDPGGVERTSSRSGPSIFERARVGGALTPGTWTIRIRGYNVKSAPQTVYWTVDIHGC